MKTKLMFTILTLVLSVPLILYTNGSSRASSDSGETVYESKCKMCHGPDGKGETKAGKMMKVPNLLEASAWKIGTSQKDVEKVVSEGAGKMPKYSGKLSPEEISAVSQYIRQLCGVIEDAH
jgi:mono/diheme cytochrome c family protein